MNLTLYLKRNYEKYSPLRTVKSKPKANPIKPNSKPINPHFQPATKKQTQFKPKQTQFLQLFSHSFHQLFEKGIRTQESVERTADSDQLLAYMMLISPVCLKELAEADIQYANLDIYTWVADEMVIIGTATTPSLRLDMIRTEEQGVGE